MNNDAKEAIKNRIRELPEKLRAFILAEAWREGVSKIAKQFNLKEEQAASLENEVFLVLLCFETPSAFKENIKTEVGLDENAGRRIADSINGTVFASVMREIKSAWAPTPQEFKPADTLDPVMMQKAMRPARNASLSSPSVAGGPAGSVPTNLPTAEPKVDARPRVVHDYSGNNDPYREPLE